MKNSFSRWMMVAALCGAFVAPVIAQDTPSPKQDMKTAGSDTKDAAKKTGRATKNGTKKVVNKSAKKTKEGADKVQDKTQPQ